MPNQTPHTPTPGFQIPPERSALGVKPPVITKELQRAYENIKKFSPKAMAILEERERKKEELQKQNQIQDYTEVAWLKVLNQDLDKPQCPQVKLLKEKQPHQECCCYELEYEWEIYYQYDWHWAMKEAEFRWIKVLTDKDWTKLEAELWEEWLIEFLWLKEPKDYKGYCNGGTCSNRESIANYWSSSVFIPSPTYSWRRYMSYSIASVSRGDGVQTYGFSVRCCLKD